MHNYPMPFAKSYEQQKKIVFLYFKRIQKVLTKTVPQIQMFLTESNPHCEDEY